MDRIRGRRVVDVDDPGIGIRGGDVDILQVIKRAADDVVDSHNRGADPHRESRCRDVIEREIRSEIISLESGVDRAGDEFSGGRQLQQAAGEGRGRPHRQVLLRSATIRSYWPRTHGAERSRLVESGADSRIGTLVRYTPEALEASE